MADLLLAKDGINTEVSDLARQIKAAQAPEITQMSGWLAGWGENPSPSMTMDHDMGGGMMNQTDMDALEKATGDEATRLFLAGMIEHHTGAIAMAQQEIANGPEPGGQAARSRHHRRPTGRDRHHEPAARPALTRPPDLDCIDQDLLIASNGGCAACAQACANHDANLTCVLLFTCLTAYRAGHIRHYTRRHP